MGCDMGVATPSGAGKSEYSHSCACGCGLEIQPSRRGGRFEREYASDACRARVRNRRTQLALTFLSAPAVQPEPASTPRGQAKVAQVRQSKWQRILARLEAGPATSFELAQITHRFSARLHERKAELRLAGLHITREDHTEDGREFSTYTLGTLEES
jgi:hypothetical protein